MRANKTRPMAITPVTANEYAEGICNEREARRCLRPFRMIALGRDIALVVSRIDREQSAMLKFDRMDAADASLVVLSEQYPRADIVTVDSRDFRVHRRFRREPLPIIAPAE